MTLTEKQIENLYAFTRKHFVEYYDLQTELVDHMANDIEAIITENPHTTFEEARDIAFKKFGVFGFMEVVEQRQKAMSKTYIKLLWHYAKNWFRLPQIILTTAIFVSLYTVFSTKIGGILFVSSYFLLCSILIIKSFSFRRKIKEKLKNNKKLWLLEDIIFKNASFGTLIIGPQIFHCFTYLETFNGYKPLIFALVFTVIIIYTYISTVVLPKNATFHLRETYPEYSL